MDVDQPRKPLRGRLGSQRRATTAADLQLQQADARTRVCLALLSFVLPVTLSLVLPLFGQHSTAASRWAHGIVQTPAQDRWLGPVLVAALAAAIWIVVDRLLRRHAVTVDENGLEIHTTLYRRRLAWTELDLAAARVIDIDEHPETKPLWKTNGIRLPGFRSGWFRSRGFRKLFVATAGGWRVLWLPTRLGYTVLLQAEHPAALLERLRATSRPGADGATHATALR